MASQGTKRASLTSLRPAKKPTLIQSLLPIPVKKPTLVWFLPLQALPSRCRYAIIRDLFEEKICSAHDKNYDNNEAANDKFSVEDLGENEDI